MGLHPDEKVALRQPAARLGTEFAGPHGGEAIAGQGADTVHSIRDEPERGVRTLVASREL